MGFVYHPGASGVLLWSGAGSGGVSQPGLFSWNGTGWTDHSNLPNEPSARQGVGMTCDPATGLVYVFGGGGGPVVDELWTLDLTAGWTQVPTSTPWPSAREGAVLVPVPGAAGAGHLLLVGGANVPAPDPNVLWCYDIATRRWSDPVDPISPRYSPAIGQDPSSDVLVLHGGAGNGQHFNDLWVVTCGGAASYTTFGTGCAGSNGTPPTLAPAPGQLPWICETFTVELKSLPPSGLGALGLVSFSKLQPPIDLGIIGMPYGCMLFVGLAPTHIVFPLPNRGGMATWTLRLSCDCTLVGRHFYQQAFVHDDGVPSPKKLTVTNGGDGVIGAR
jgi:hypothetical protein